MTRPQAATALIVEPPDAAPNTSITVYLPRETKTAIKVRCAAEGESISDYALRLILADMAR